MPIITCTYHPCFVCGEKTLVCEEVCDSCGQRIYFCDKHHDKMDTIRNQNQLSVGSVQLGWFCKACRKKILTKDIDEIIVIQIDLIKKVNEFKTKYYKKIFYRSDI